MKPIAKSLLFLISFVYLIAYLNFSSSLNISLNSPAEVKIDMPFLVSVQADTSDIYDVKIYVRNSSDSIISSIEDEKWKSGIYYVNDAYPSKSQFNLKVNEMSEPAFICIKFRISEKRKTKPPTPEICSDIKIINNTQEDHNSNSAGNQQDQDKNLLHNKSASISSNNSADFNLGKDIKSTNIKVKNKTKAGSSELISSSQKESDSEDDSVVILTAQVPKGDSEEKYVSTAQKTRLMALYTFTLISIMIVLFLLMRKI